MNDLPLADGMPEQAYTYGLKIPKERVAVLIGQSGSTKKELETQTGCVIDVDSKEGDVQLSGEDSVQIYMLKDIIKAIGRGFNPEIAMRLLKADYVLELIDLSEFVNNRDHLPRVRGRVIGKNGMAREKIEEFTETSLSVYGKTVAIIGFCDYVAAAKKAVDMLLQGSPHTAVFKWLEKYRKKQEFERAVGL